MSNVAAVTAATPSRSSAVDHPMIPIDGLTEQHLARMCCSE
jgi:hypothetical protein